MNPQAQVVLDQILKIEPDNLTEDQKAFLRARSSYLKKSQLEEYDHVLNPKVKSQTSEKETVKKDDKPQTTN